MGWRTLIEIEASVEGGVSDVDLERLSQRIRFTCARVGIDHATVGLMVIGPDEMARINGEHRDTPEPTDVLSFPVDGPRALSWPVDGPAPELGDIIICPDAAEEPLTTLAVHGLLHLVGYDHEVDSGEMLALQDDIVDAADAADAADRDDDGVIA